MACVLFVEGENDRREVLEAMRQAGFRGVESVPPDAIIQLLTLGKLGLVVTDINCSGAPNGIELAMTARAIWPEIALIFLSGDAAVLEQARSLCHPASYIEKPFTLKVLIEAVQRGMRLHLAGPAKHRSFDEDVPAHAMFEIDPKGFVVTWSPGAAKINGYATDEAVGMHFSAFFTADDQACHWPARSLQAARDLGRFEDERWRVRKDGRRFRARTIIDATVDRVGVVTGFLQIICDVTETHAARKALELSERHMRLLVENVVRYAVYTLDVEGFVDSWESGAEIATGYSIDEILGKSLSVFYTSEDRSQGKPAAALRMATETGRFEEEGWRVRQGGTRFWARVVLEPMRDEANQLVGFAQITHNIDDKRLLEEARRLLYRTQEMEMIRQLAGGVTHDFNNCLVSVMGGLELIAALPNDQGTVERLARAATNAMVRSAKLTKQLLWFCNHQPLAPEVSDINDLIADIHDLLRHAVERAIDIHIELSPQIWLTDVDRAHFHYALLNIALNARDAMPNGGVLTIETENINIDSSEAALLTEIAPGPYVMVTVRDTGCGMTPQVLARATEPLYTTKEAGHAAGLGLNQAQGFARQSKGQIEIKSKIGMGTSVTLYLPQSGKKLPHAMELGRLSVDLQGGIILVVEDDPQVLEVAVIAIESFGYHVHSAPDGRSALEMLKRNERIDLLFTDVVMPSGLSGVELARQAYKLRPKLRVLLASGYPRSIIQKTEGVEDFMELITKPYALSTLSERLRTMTLGVPN